MRNVIMGKFIDVDWASKTVERKIAHGLLIAGIIVLLCSVFLQLRLGIYAAGVLLVLYGFFYLLAWSHYFKK